MSACAGGARGQPVIDNSVPPHPPRVHCGESNFYGAERSGGLGFRWLKEE